MNCQTAGKRIKAARLEAGLTQSMLAEHIGRSVQYVGHIERGTRTMSIETLCRICAVLHISTQHVLDI